MSIFGIILLVILSCILVYELVQIIITLVRRVREKKEQEKDGTKNLKED